jgi:hypothetical protein
MRPAVWIIKTPMTEKKILFLRQQVQKTCEYWEKGTKKSFFSKKTN